MKKLIGATSLLMMSAMPVWAQGDQTALELDLAGYFRGYVAYASQDTAAGSTERHVDILRDAKIYMDGKTVLDNGLTVGLHFEFRSDMGDGFAVDKSFLYLSNDWGKVNFGGVDGVGYLLQVAAPSADGNVDGLRQYIQSVNYNLVGGAIGPQLQAVEWDYAHDVTASSDKISYFSPKLSGLQLGVSYTPDVQATSFTGNSESSTASRGLNGVSTDDVAGAYGAAWELAARYERKMETFGVTLGAGYSHVDHEADAAGEDDLSAWNVGAAMTVSDFGFGVAYTENDNGRDPDNETNILVLGADYKTGPWKLGGSWYMRDDENLTGSTDLESDRYVAGVIYKYGPGMDLRSSVSYLDHDFGAENVDATSFVIGTQITF